MSDNSRSRVTVTLGRSGRVVKRGDEVPDDGFSNGFFAVGRKRSVRDRLGTDSYDRNEDYNKRHRGDSFRTNRLNDVHLDKHDLRFRLMQKSRVRQLHNNNGSHDNFDLRDKLLSKTSRVSTQSKKFHPPKAIVTRQQHEHVLDPRNTGRDASTVGRFPSATNTSDLSLLDTGKTYSSLNMGSLRRRSPERLLHPSTSRRLSPQRNRKEYPYTTRRVSVSPERNREDLQRRSPERLLHPSSSRRLSPQRNRKEFPYTTRRVSVSPERNREELHRRSPERLLRPSTTRALSPQGIREELVRRPSMRTFDDGRSSSLRISPLRHASSPYLARSSVSDTSIKCVAPFGSLYPQTSGVVLKIPSMGVEHPTVESFLRYLGLEKYAIIFKAEEIDMNSLRQLGDRDLKDLGIPMGPRKKILESIIPRFRRLP